MTAPVCRGCGVARVKPVRRKVINRPYRFAEGQHWYDYCSRACVARVVGKTYRHKTTMDALNAANRKLFAVRRGERIKAAAEKIAELSGVPMRALLAFGIACEEVGYHRGFSCAWQQQRRKALA